MNGQKIIEFKKFLKKTNLTLTLNVFKVKNKIVLRIEK